MKKMALLLVHLIVSTCLWAQNQTADGEGQSQATALKKIDKEASFGTHLSLKQISFSTGKGLDGMPVVVANEKGTIEMVSVEKNVYMGHMLGYNSFVQLRDYDFEVFYKNKFRSQKYPPRKISLTDDAIFFDDNYGLYYGMEAQESGQRCRFLYNYQYVDAKYLTRLFFHSSHPVKENTIEFTVPSWLELDLIEKNFEASYKIKKTTRKEGDKTIYSYTAQNLAPVKQEPSALARPYYLPHIIVSIKTFKVDNKTNAVFDTMDNMYAWYNLLYKKAKNETAGLKPVVDNALKGKQTDEDKIKALYYWVQDNIKYIAFEEGYSGFVPHTVQEVYKNKYGDCKGMANLLTELLKIAGYDAHFAWIGTREIPYDRKEVRSLCVDNHAIAVLYHNGKTYFLDGTEKYAPLGVNAYRIQGKSVLVEHGDTYKIEEVPSARPEDNTMATSAKLKLQGTKMVGHVRLSFTGEARNFFHYIYNSIPSNKRKEFIASLIELNNSGTDVANVKTSDFSNRDIPLVVEGDVEISNRVTQVDKLHYTSIDFFPASFASFLPAEKRQTPIDLDHVLYATDDIRLELPENALVKTLPPQFESAFGQNTMQAQYSVHKNELQLTKKMQLQSPVIQPAQFADWKSFLLKIKEFNRTTISIQL